MWTVVILVFLAMAVYEFVLRFLAYKSQGLPAPANLRDIYDNETYAKRSAYGKEKLRLIIIEHICVSLVTLAFLLSNIHSALFYYIGQHTSNMYLQAIFMLGVVVLISQSVKIAFAAVMTFKIEAKYGFNKSSPRTFVGDRARNLLIVHLGLFLGAVALFMFLRGVLGSAVFVAFFLVFALFEIVLGLFAAFFMGGKRKPLEDGALRAKIEALLAKANFPIDKIFVRDDSKRTSKPNAYCAGIGKSMAVSIGDNLLDTEKYSDDDALCIIAHEIGHAKGHHALLKKPLRLAIWAVLVVMAYFVVNSAEVSLAFGFTELNVAFGVYVLIIFFMPAWLLFDIPINAISHAHEFAADSFEARMVGKEAAIASLKKGARDNFENLTPHPFVALAHNTHPSLARRIENIEKSV